MAAMVVRFVSASLLWTGACASQHSKDLRKPLPNWPDNTSLPHDPDVGRSLPGLVAQTANGPVVGLLSEGKKNICQWWGIPFAEPPVMDLRLKAPVSVRRKWTDPFSAINVPPSCEDVEDCLYLNVFSPESALKVGATKRPVMVWFYGGGFDAGNSFEYGLYDGTNLAKAHNVVIVTVNYRLGLAGFMALDALRDEDPDKSVGNYGTQDQRLGLQWVKENIANFGGDANRVTIFGESAGGMSVMWHLVSPASAGLFQAAIMESGANSITYFFQPYELASTYAEDIASGMNCSSALGASRQLECLRKLSFSDFFLGTTNPKHQSPLWPIMPVGPVIDGTDVGLVDIPLRLVQKGAFNKVPLILGANENGGSIFEPMIPQIIPGARWPATLHPETVNKTLDYMAGENASRVRSVYDKEEFKAAMFPADAMLSRVVRDLMFMCPMRSLAAAWASHNLPTYMYVFHFEYGLLVDRVVHLGDFHAGELPFVFKNWLFAVRAVGPATDGQRMSDIMSCKWTSFAYSHSPNGDADQSNWPPNCEAVNNRYNDWPEYNPTERLYYELRTTPQIHKILGDNHFPNDVFPSDEKCDLLEPMEAYMRWAGFDSQKRPTLHSDALASVII